MKFKYKHWKSLVITVVIYLVLLIIQFVPRLMYGFDTFDISSHVFCECNDVEDLEYGVRGIDSYSRYCEYCGIDLNKASGYVSLSKNYCETCDEYTWDFTYHSDCGKAVDKSNYTSLEDLGLSNVNQFYIIQSIVNVGVYCLVYASFFVISQVIRLSIAYKEWVKKLDELAPEPILK